MDHKEPERRDFATSAGLLVFIREKADDIEKVVIPASTLPVFYRLGNLNMATGNDPKSADHDRVPGSPGWKEQHPSGSFTAFVLGVAVATGFLVWACSRMLTGKVEPWDGTVLYPLAILPGFLCCALTSRKIIWTIWTVIYYWHGFWVGQVLALTTVPHLSERGWVSLGVITTYFGAMFIAQGVFLSWCMYRWALTKWASKHPAA